MTCKKCRHWEQCVLPDGTTHYYGKEAACANVDHLCEWFIPKNEQPKWIPVTERLPEKSGEYLAYCGEYNGICVLYCEILKTKIKWRTKWKDVTHWMPLPEAPKEGE